ncbi:hypothetical protein FRB95_007101 [Tulasnella sp. JGI-2019a]|nr:hypothetical protein FRB93_004528 [Tulasnella sp. JGI-2019a]KAG9027867.1 hypothetical protein FRB95_007101 [Tulasnella sp. JGI-2019a]
MESNTKVLPHSWREDFNSGVNAFRLKRYEVALEHLSTAIRLGADRANVFDLRATVFDLLKRPKDALKDAKKVIQLAPNSHKGYTRAAESFDAIGNRKAALLMTQQALQRVGESNVRHSDLRRALLCQLEVYQEHQRRTTCHVALLPVEMLALVFQYGSRRHADDLMEDASPQSTIDNTFVKRVSHVCRHWREVAIGTPALWQSLVLGRGKLEAKAKEWSTRANGSIRELVVLAPFSHDLATDAPLTVVLRKHLCIPPTVLRIDQGPSYRELRCFRTWLATMFGEAAVRLSEVEVSRDSQTTQSGQRMWRPFSWSGLPLVALSLRGASIDWCLQEFINLKSIALRDAYHIIPSLDHTVHKLSQSPDLETLVLVGNGPSPPITSIAPAAPQKVEFRRLSYLEMEGRLWDIEMFIGRVALPNLQTLKLRTIKNLVCKVLIESRIGQSTMTELRLQACWFVPDDLIRALGFIGQSLELLEISRAALDVNVVVDALAGRRRPSKTRVDMPPSTGVLCPNLVDIIFTYLPRLSGAPIKELVKSRTTTTSEKPPEDRPNGTGGVDIRSLILEECPLVEPELVPWLRTRIPHVICAYGNLKRQEARRML